MQIEAAPQSTTIGRLQFAGKSGSMDESDLRGNTMQPETTPLEYFSAKQIEDCYVRSIASMTERMRWHLQKAAEVETAILELKERLRQHRDRSGVSTTEQLSKAEL